MQPLLHDKQWYMKGWNEIVHAKIAAHICGLDSTLSTLHIILLITITGDKCYVCPLADEEMEAYVG